MNDEGTRLSVFARERVLQQEGGTFYINGISDRLPPDFFLFMIDVTLRLIVQVFFFLQDRKSLL